MSTIMMLFVMMENTEKEIMFNASKQEISSRLCKLYSLEITLLRKLGVRGGFARMSRFSLLNA